MSDYGNYGEKRGTDNNVGTMFIACFFNIVAQNIDSRTKAASYQILPLALSGWYNLDKYCMTFVSLSFNFFIIVPTS